MASRAILLLALALLADPSRAQPAPAEITLEQLLAQRGWSAVQLRENAFSQLEVDVLLNGEHRLRVQISTSFSKTVFDEAVVKKLGLPIEPTSIEIEGPGRKQRLGTLQLQSLAFGEISVGAVTVFTADLSELVGRAGVEPVQGVIGSDFLTKYQAVLEIPTSKLYLRLR